MRNEFRKIALDIQLANPKDVVKTAGILKRLKNVFKQMVDSDYAGQVSKLNSESVLIKSISSQLNKKTNELLEAIKDGDFETYESCLTEVKELSAGLAAEIGKLNKEVRTSVNEDAPISSAKPYNLETWKNDSDKIKNKVVNDIKKRNPDFEFLPTGPINKLMFEIPIFRNSVIEFRPGAAAQLQKDLEKIVGNEFTNGEKNIADGINAGTLLTWVPADPDKQGKVKFRNPGETHLLVKTAPISISDTTFTAIVGLTDTRFTKNSYETPGANTLIFRKIMKVLEKSKRVDLQAEDSPLPPKKAFEKLASQLLPYKVTKLNGEAFAKALAEGYKLAFGSYPSLEVLGSAWAQASLESGNPATLPNNNIGNIKADKGWINAGNNYFIKDTKEIDKSGQEYTEHGTKWRAYATPEEGAAGYWRFIGNNRYKEALDWMAAGDAEAAATTLGQKGYYTANIAKYSSAVGSLYNTFVTSIAPKLSFLKSNPKPAPGPKPVISKPGDESDKLISGLLANGPVDEMVKTAILFDKLPTSNILISIASLSASFGTRYKFATTLQKSLKQICGGDIKLTNFDDKLELNCKIPGTNYIVANAIKEIADLIKVNNKINYIIIPE